MSDASALSTPACNRCQATLRPGRLSLAYLARRIREDVWGTERGLLLTVWHLLQYPGRVTGAFIRGDDLRYYGPVKYFLVVLAASILLLPSLPLFDGAIAGFVARKGLMTTEAASAFVADWNSLLYVPLLLLLATATRLFFRENGLNYAEHLVVAAYGWSQMVLIASLALALLQVMKWLGLSGGLRPVILLLAPLWWLWYCRSVFGQKTFAGWLRAFASIPAAMTAFLFLIVAVVALAKALLPAV